jgi:N-acetylglucosaminyldiphosphoundecaprenol N-acetyl-beta-D-mannosaminyltransferase
VSLLSRHIVGMRMDATFYEDYTGRVRQAPGWMQVMGLEWLFRLMMEPRRLWKRYAKHNSRFVVLFFAQMLGLFRNR